MKRKSNLRKNYTKSITPVMDFNFFSLSFDKSLEKKFKADYYRSSINLLRISFLLGMFYYSVFAFLDAFAMPEIRTQLFQIRFLLVCPVILLIFILSYTKNFFKWWQLAASIAVVVSGFGIVLMILIAPEIGRYNYYPGIILVLIYNYMLIKLRFIWSTLSGFMLILIYALSLTLYPELDTKLIGINFFFLVSANILGMFGGYVLEYYTRRDFYYRHLLEKERRSIEYDNTKLEALVNEKTQELQEDIRKRKEIEKALRESEQKYRFLADNSIDVIWQMDLKLKFTYVSPSIKKLTGHTTEEWIGSRLSEHATRKEFIKMAKKAIGPVKKYKKFKNIDHITFEAELIKKDGSTIPVEITGSIIYDKTGIPVRIQGSTKDITERKQADESIKRSLKEKNILIRELYHRTKNNMQVVASLIKLKIRKYKDSKLSRELQGINNKIISMSLVHEKLYQSNDLSSLNLDTYLQELVKRLCSNYNAHDDVALKFEFENVKISIDVASPLGLVVTELISNVFKHAFPDNREGTLKISLYQDPDGMIKLIIKDNGVSIPADLDLRNTDSMGLSNAINLIEYQMKGDIQYEKIDGLKWTISFNDKQNIKRV